MRTVFGVKFSASGWLLLCGVAACGDGAAQQSEAQGAGSAGGAPEVASSGEPTELDAAPPSPSTSDPVSTDDASDDSATSPASGDSATDDSATDDSATDDSASGEGESSDVPSMNDASSGGPSRDDAPPDDASGQAASTDASATDAARNDAGPSEDEVAELEPPSECAERTLTRPGGGAIEVGSFCDVVFVCVTSEQQRRFAALAPSFECSAATGEYGCSEVQCELRPAAADRRITGEELAQICELGAEDADLGVIECRVYV